MQNTLSYQLSFAQKNAHIVQAQLTFTAKQDNPTLWLPTWVAGSYLVRELAKNINTVRYAVNANISIKTSNFSDENLMRATKNNKNTWQVSAKQGDTVNIFYTIYCFDLSVRTAYIDNARIFANFSSLLLQVTGSEHDDCQIELIDLAIDADSADCPHNICDNSPIFAIGLPFNQTEDGLLLDKLPNGAPLTSFAALDFPFEYAPQAQAQFAIIADGATILHRFFISGILPNALQLNDLTRDTQKICQSYADWLGYTPFADYTFMAHATPNEYGGLEHINSTALIIPADDLPTHSHKKDDYTRLLGLISHEYFHAWWVKSVRPNPMMTADMTAEVDTSLLWVFEGFTSYIDDLMLYKSGVIDGDDYLKLLGGQIKRYLNTDGRYTQSLLESAFDAWIKLYRPDENSQNSRVSYYNKGALVAFGLDVLLMRHGKRLLDVIFAFTQSAKKATDGRFGLTNDAIGDLLSDYTKGEWAQFYAQFVAGLDELPLECWLNTMGASLKITQNDLPFGINIDDSLTIKSVLLDGAAAKAGLSANDQIVAIDGIKTTKTRLQTTWQAAKAAAQQFAADAAASTVRVHFFRMDVLRVLSVPFSDSARVDKVEIAAQEGTQLKF